MFMQIGTSDLEALLALLKDLLATPKNVPLPIEINTAGSSSSTANIQKFMIKAPLISADMWADFLIECIVGLTRNWYEFQNEVLMQIYTAHCSRGNRNTGGCLTNFYMEFGDREPFGPANTGGRHELHFKGILGCKSMYDLALL